MYVVYIYSGGPRPNDERADGGRPRDKTERIEPGAVFEKCGEQMRLGLVGGKGWVGGIGGSFAMEKLEDGEKLLLLGRRLGGRV